METMTPMDFMKFRSVTVIMNCCVSGIQHWVSNAPLYGENLSRVERSPRLLLPAESTLARVYMGKKLTPLPEPTALAHALIIRDITIQRREV